MLRKLAKFIQEQKLFQNRINI